MIEIDNVDNTFSVSDPIGRIDLGSCVTDNVTIAPREICSRMNTFMLETSRTARQDDKESLVIQRKGGDSRFPILK